MPEPRLPAGPLLDAIAAELATGDGDVRLFLARSELRAYRLAKAEGTVTTRMAARLCAAIDRCPREVFGDAHDAPVSRGKRVAVASPAFERLPAGPLVEAIEARLQRLADRLMLLTDPGVARGEALRVAFGEDETLKRTFYRTRQRGWVLLETAERLCDAFGWHPWQIWGEDYDRAAFAGCEAGYDPWQGVA